MKSFEGLKIIFKIKEVLKKIWGWVKSTSVNSWYRCSSYVKRIKLSGIKLKGKGEISKLPWYLILGSPQSGKKSVVSNFGIYFSQPKHAGIEAENYIQQFPDYDWWFSQQCVLVDVMSQIKESHDLCWKRFVKLLKREKKYKPISGIILIFSMADILLYSNQNRQEFIQAICMYIRTLHQAFKSKVPVYLVLNKADLIEGFMEFFSDMSKDELSQVWGMTLPLEICSDPTRALEFYNEEYTAMVEKLKNKVLWALDSERDSRGRELIHSFPQQMQLLRRPLETFILELFSAVRFQRVLQLRGIYFCSSKQEGETYDFLLQAMSKKFQLVPPVLDHPQRVGECYFLPRLFYEVIYPEEQLLGESYRSRKLKKTAYQSALIGAPMLVLLVLITMHEGDKENILRIQAVKSNIAKYEQLKLRLDQSSNSLIKTLPLLKQLSDAQFVYNESKPMGMDFLLETEVIGNQINRAMEQFLSNIFMPRVAAQIEERLKENITDQNVLYATLKGYLAFSPSPFKSKEAIKAPMEYYWSQTLKHNLSVRKQLRYYLNLAIIKPISKLPLDTQLIGLIRSKLATIIPSKRAYGLLKLRSSVGGLPQYSISSAVGIHFNTIFSMKKNILVIPVLYTKSGFHKIFLAQYKKIAAEVYEDNKNVGLSQGDYEDQSIKQIEVAMQLAYELEYERHWNEALCSIKIRPFSNLNHAAYALELLTGKLSPMAKLLNVLFDNTNTILYDKVDVASYFNRINQFQIKNAKFSWDSTETLLKQLQTYLTQIKDKPDINKAEYDAVLKTISSGKSPIISLTTEAENLPTPLKTWLNTIANNSWHVLLKGTHAYVNNLWKTKVVQYYEENIKGRYPIEPRSNADISINDFNVFFGVNGIINNFFQEYIKPFIDTDTNHWENYSVRNHNFEITHKHLKLFKRAFEITREYFSNNDHNPKLTFLVKPLALDSNASSITFKIGGHTIQYSHGPQIGTLIHWPFEENSDGSEIVLSTFNNHHYRKRFVGPWSIFKILNNGDFTQRQLGHYIFHVDLDGHRASFLIYGEEGKSIYQLTALKYFNLPEQIISATN